MPITRWTIAGHHVFFAVRMIQMFAGSEPWASVPLADDLPAWFGLHRSVWIPEATYFSAGCERLSDFRLAYWNTADPYVEMDGPDNTHCVRHQIVTTKSGSLTNYIHDYTRASCEEKYRFYCQHETGPCTFERLTGFMGETGGDFTPGNDQEYPFTSHDACVELCLNASDIYPHPDALVIEECWGFTTTAEKCLLHIVLRASYFDTATHRVASPESTLYIKRCFEAAVNSDNKTTLSSANARFPLTQCGIPDFDNTALTSREVELHVGTWTWNEAFITCRSRGMTLMNAKTDNDYFAVKMLFDKHFKQLNEDMTWLGIHEPSPVTYPGVRAWSDCEGVVNTHWDPISLPSGNINDDHLCTVVNVTTGFWYTTACLERHSFVCVGQEVHEWAYDFGTHNTTGTGIKLGPYRLANDTCRDTCDRYAHGDMDCWAYVIGIDDVTCYLLYSSDVTFQNTGTEVTSEPVVLYRKQLWNDNVIYNSVNTSHDGLLPISCCNLTNVNAACPQNERPTYDVSVATMTSRRLILHTSKATWNDASSTCQSYGANLLAVDSVAMRHMIERYMSTWAANGDLSGVVWTGLHAWRSGDPCSLRWEDDCSSVTWTEFPVNGDHVTDVDRRCGTLSLDMTWTKQYCNETLQFVCQLDDGPCNTKDLNATDDARCDDACRTMVNVNMECWAYTYVSTTCTLYFHQDPDFIRENPAAITTSGDVIYKTCYSSYVNRSANVEGFIGSLETSPLMNCALTVEFPASFNTFYCDEVQEPSPIVSAIISTTVQQADSTTGISPTPTETLLTSQTDDIMTSQTDNIMASQTDNIMTSQTDGIMTSQTDDNMTSQTDGIMTSQTDGIMTSQTDGIMTSQTDDIMTSQTDDIMTSQTQVLDISVQSSSSTFDQSETSLPVSATSFFTSIPPTSAEVTVPISPSSVSTMSLTASVPVVNYIWPCLCANGSYNVTFNEWEQDLREKTTINKQNTTKYYRSLNSAYEPSLSFTVIGSIASCLIFSIVLYIVITDIPKVRASFRVIHRMDAAHHKNKSNRKI